MALADSLFLLLVVGAAHAVTLGTININVEELLGSLPEQDLIDAITAVTSKAIRFKLVEAWGDQAASSSNTPPGTSSTSLSLPAGVETVDSAPQHPIMASPDAGRRLASAKCGSIPASVDRWDGRGAVATTATRNVCENYFTLCAAQSTERNCSMVATMGYASSKYGDDYGKRRVLKEIQKIGFKQTFNGGDYGAPEMPACAWTGTTCVTNFEAQSQLLQGLAVVKKEQANMKGTLAKCVERRLLAKNPTASSKGPAATSMTLYNQPKMCWTLLALFVPLGSIL